MGRRPMAIASELSEVHPAEGRFLEGVPGSGSPEQSSQLTLLNLQQCCRVRRAPACYTHGRDCATSTAITSTVLLAAKVL